MRISLSVSSAGFSPVNSARGFSDHADVRVEADVGDVSALFGAQQVSRSRISRSLSATPLPEPPVFWAIVAMVRGGVSRCACPSGE